MRALLMLLLLLYGGEIRAQSDGQIGRKRMIQARRYLDGRLLLLDYQGGSCGLKTHLAGDLESVLGEFFQDFFGASVESLTLERHDAYDGLEGCYWAGEIELMSRWVIGEAQAFDLLERILQEDFWVLESFSWRQNPGGRIVLEVGVRLKLLEVLER